MRKYIYKVKKGLRLFVAILRLFHSRLFNKRKPGVAQVVNSFNTGGLEQVALNIYKGFLKHGDGSYVISITNNIGIMANDLKSPMHLRIINGDIVDMINYCAKFNIRALNFHFTTFEMKLLKLLGFKTYYVIHNTYIWFKKSDWTNLKHDLNYCDHIVAVSDWSKNYFTKKTGIKNITTILNGIDIKNVLDFEDSKHSRESLNIKENDKVFLTIGAYTTGKNQMSLIGIMEKIIKVRDDIKFLCVGHVLDKEYYDLFKKKLSKSPAKENIISLDFIPQREIGYFINNIADAYLQPSIHEAGVPLSVMEALVGGLPVIMTDFSVKKTFADTNRIFAVKTPYKDITKLKPADAIQIAKDKKNDSTNDFVSVIYQVTDNLDNLKNDFDINKFNFLSIDVMQQKYIELINLK